jgi:GTPase SAR1 family protein
MLVGNKSDLDEDRKVSKQDGLSFAEKNRVAFYEVSAKTGSNVDLIFSKIAECILFIKLQNLKKSCRNPIKTKSKVSPAQYRRQSNNKSNPLSKSPPRTKTRRPKRRTPAVKTEINRYAEGY